MESLVIQGGVPLSGRIRVEGAKNAALPACVASLLTDEPVILHEVPQLRDVSTILYTLGSLGKRVVRNGKSVVISGDGPLSQTANAYSVKKMRASFLVLGPLVARLGRAIVPLPGGCAIGQRPVDMHLRGLQALGACLEENGATVVVSAERLRGTSIDLAFPSVGATEHLLMTGALADGETVITRAAVEPEVLDLISLLRKMGAEVDVDVVRRTIRICGTTPRGAEHTLIPDRMEAGTLLLAGAITGGRVSVDGARAEHMRSFLDSLVELGCRVDEASSGIEVSSGLRTTSVEIRTGPHPAFPTDLHPPIAALLACSAGHHRIVETVFEERFTYVDALRAMGAQIVVDGRTATITGVKRLTGARAQAPDIRAGAAIVLAALAAQEESVVSGLEQVDRGYEALECKLRGLGAHIERREA